MIFLLFQLLDLLTAGVLVGAQFGLVSWEVLLYHGTYLVAKGAWYWKDPLSLIDIAAGAYTLLLITGFTHWSAYAFAGYFTYKFLTYWLWNA